MMNGIWLTPLAKPDVACPMKLPAPMMVAISLKRTRYSGNAPPPIAYMAKLLVAESLTRQETRKKITQNTRVTVMTIVANILAPSAACDL